MGHHCSQFSWPKQFPVSINGTRQSPIDIKEKDAEKVLLPQFNLRCIEGDPNANWTMTNNGHTLSLAPAAGCKWQLGGQPPAGQVHPGPFPQPLGREWRL